MTARGLSAAIVIALGLAARTSMADERDQGFEPSIYVGVGGYANNLKFSGQPWAAGALEPSVGIHADLAYRIIRIFDLGLHVFHQWIDASGLPENVEVRTTAPGAGILGRVHPLAVLAPRQPFDIALGTGFDVSAAARQKKETKTATETIEEHSAVTGFAVPFWLSMDVAVVKNFSLGVMAMWAPWFRVEECRYAGSSGVSTDCRREPTASDRYIFFGVGARVHLEFVK